MLISVVKALVICVEHDFVSIQRGFWTYTYTMSNCLPGHGISIGSLGKDKTKACVSNVTIWDIMLHNTMNGVRIKTWHVK